MTDEQAAQLQMLVDREAIRDVMMRYAFGMDRCDEDVIYSVYWPDAVEHHGVFNGPVKEWVPYSMVFADNTDQMQHFIGNIMMRITGNTARGETYFNAYMRNKTDDGPQDFIVAGRYVDNLEKRGSEWRILKRHVAFDWFRTLKGSADWKEGIGGQPMPMGSRAPDDEACKVFANDSLAVPIAC